MSYLSAVHPLNKIGYMLRKLDDVLKNQNFLKIINRNLEPLQLQGQIETLSLDNNTKEEYFLLHCEQ